MRSRLPPLRVFGLALGAGAVSGGLVMALLGSLVHMTGLVAGGLVGAAMGAVLLVAGADGFALQGLVRAEGAGRVGADRLGRRPRS